jgi:hypothetical protein
MTGPGQFTIDDVQIGAARRAATRMRTCPAAGCGRRSRQTRCNGGARPVSLRTRVTCRTASSSFIVASSTDGISLARRCAALPDQACNVRGCIGLGLLNSAADRSPTIGIETPGKACRQQLIFHEARRQIRRGVDIC